MKRRGEGDGGREHGWNGSERAEEGVGGGGEIKQLCDADVSRHGCCSQPQRPARGRSAGVFRAGAGAESRGGDSNGHGRPGKSFGRLARGGLRVVPAASRLALFEDLVMVRMVRVSHMETKKKFMLSAFLGTLLLAAGCGEKKPETVAAAPPPAPSEGLTAVQPKLEEALTVTGPLVVEHPGDVTEQRDGVVSSISSEAGTRVKAGTALARLDDRQLSANLEAVPAKT